jgi:hypothetical protein
VIEQTELVVTEWHYHPPSKPVEPGKHIFHSVSLEVMKKRAGIKKGIACRFSCRFTFENETILEYTGEDSYVIDLADKIDKNELLRMIRNSYSKFNEKFDLRKFGTALQGQTLRTLEEHKIDLDSILPLLE